MYNHFFPSLVLLGLTLNTAWAAGFSDPEPVAPPPAVDACPQGTIPSAPETEGATATDDATPEGDTPDCVAPDAAALDDDALFRTVIALSEKARYAEALAVLDTMGEAQTDRVLTQRGFLLRKTGRTDEALLAYDAALARNPDNFLARSYLGLGLLEMGDVAAARAQLTEIRRRGGRQTRAEFALRFALRAGRPVAY
ncbi:MAG: tetratricopeptide repeat protein [Pseudomonadota bacterium]